LDTTVRKTAPDGHEERSNDDRAYQRDTVEQWFTSDLKVEELHNKKNGEQPDNDRTHDAVGCAPASE
jgi:hypothetical protein